MAGAATIDANLLRAVLDTIIPRDQDPGATDLGVDRYALHQLGADRRDQTPGIAAGLAALAAKNFATLDAPAQIDALKAIEHEPWFVNLAELAAEGYYADPENGGNAGAASWTMIGYQPRLPKPPLPVSQT
jgi:Gluconate 2-dehydrogenase subunit 3